MIRGYEMDIHARLKRMEENQKQIIGLLCNPHTAGMQQVRIEGNSEWLREYILKDRGDVMKSFEDEDVRTAELKEDGFAGCEIDLINEKYNK